MDFDVIVIGGGHAGCEAAAAAARVGAKVALITYSLMNIGATSCNPSMGGIGKTHIMNEIEACDGIISEVTDHAATQKRELNESRGYAVRAMRAILDRQLYQEEMLKKLNKYSDEYGLKIIEAEVTDLLISKNNEVLGVITNNKTEITSKTVVITTGTFLNGLIHIGKKTKPAGRVNENASIELPKTFDKLGITKGRLKTGTPPRLNKNTINFDVLEEQASLKENVFFSSKVTHSNVGQIPCFITSTNSQTHKIIHENLHLSPMYSGQIESRGPRYCPSIEDKVVRFASRDSHTIFLEIEGHNSNIVYPSGISTSLPEFVQDQIIHSIKGLENVEILNYGYAIEYDYVDPRQLTNTLEVIKVPNLFLAGQINGTTGYEEAAGQGLVAGANAGLKALRKNPFILKRNNSYIGIMIDDLINLGTKEPYRMFTSRAEFRLTMRNDNADLRLTEYANSCGLVGSERYRFFIERRNKLETELTRLKSTYLGYNELQKLNTGADGVKKSLFDLLSYPNVTEENFISIHETLDSIDRSIIRTVFSEAKYSPYIKRQESEIKALQEYYDFEIPQSIDYDHLPSLSTEEREKLKFNKPRNIRAAYGISGITSSAIMNIILYIKRKHKQVVIES
jgi:tRNA uridine 5-carboxymethylaminomethyl modification enzyme